MQIVRNDSDVLVLEAAPARGGLMERIAVVVLFLVMAGILGAVVHQAQWLRGLAPSARLIAGVCSAVGFLALAYFGCAMFRETSMLAFDRATHRVLCLRTSLGRTYRDEFDFDEVQGLVLQQPLFLRNATWSLHLILNAAPGRSRSKIPIASEPWKDPLDDMAAAIQQALGREQKTVPECKGAFSWALRFVFGSLALGYAAWAGAGHWDKWQSASWPRADGVVEAVQLGKKLYDRNQKRSPPLLNDAIEIDYRYSVEGVEYRGTQFNLFQNWLSPLEVRNVELRYRPGQTCPVAFKPSNPAKSFLTTDGAQTFISDLKVDATIGLAGLIWIAWNAWQVSRRREPAAGRAAALATA